MMIMTYRKMESLKIKGIGTESVKSWDHKGLTQIVQIIVSYDNESLKSLQFVYLKNGNLQITEVIGSNHIKGSMLNTDPPPSYYSCKSFSFNFGGLNQFGGFHGTQNSVSVMSSIGVYFNHLTALPSGFLQPTQDQEDEDEDEDENENEDQDEDHVGIINIC
ncbi:hypothetical protein V2J09_007925 [Rumex salicifolius]